MKRSHYNNNISLNEVGQMVQVLGWVSRIRKFGGITFVDLRDTSGIVQIVFNQEFSENLKLGREDLLAVRGTVLKRGEANPKIKSGEVEVSAIEYQIISKSSLPPFLIEDESDALEETRLEYRYLDLRRPVLQNILKLRSKTMQIIRNHLIKENFVEVDTPLLVLSTPEGARDYVVPSRITPGHFYALPQSPQMYKQLLMVAGLERYFQIAHCLRDEDLRADRQPEFMQVDIETSFLNEDEVLALLEKLTKEIFKKTIGYKVKTPFRRLEYKDAIRLYGSDKPDTRVNLVLEDFDFIKEIDFENFKLNPYARVLKIPGHNDYFSRKVQDNLNLEAKKYSLPNLIFFKMENNTLEGGFVKFLNEALIKKIIETYQMDNGDTLILSYGKTYLRVSELLGSLRLSLGAQFNLVNNDEYDILWVTNFALFEYSEAQQRYVATHHQFTRPRDEHLPFLESDPSKVLSYAYDLVINGYEAGGGSLRIYDQDVQKQIFNILGFSEEDVQTKFGFFVDAFKYGTPPHGGFAYGLDRLIMLLSKTDNIRDVIAFPKNLRAVDPMSKAPQKISQEQLDELFLEIKEDKE